MANEQDVLDALTKVKEPDLDEDIVDDWVARFDKGTAEDMVLNLRTGRMVFSGNCTE